ncbi:MAG TPA: tRNA 2-thiouridine(34) synthase MnmA [Armatimonadota bacterium]|nr:tRNA 2-thiouridine(34) synthase MnmA [Armatimonadota bacterium]HPP75319.1 tRNA 2-thiouridine(34) synthase MnmA [Armatimonadota bacterium]
MSGGVDSSVAAAILVEKGYEVIGVTMCLLRGTEEERFAGSCCTPEAVEDARRVAAKLGIRHVVIPMQDVFQQFVIDDFINEYRRGHTPNPCVQCNRFIKFDALLNWARSVGAEIIATGHYARINYDEERGRWLLLRGKDRSKDQSYALFRLTQDQLEHTLFPVGEITKEETREKAGELGLIVAQKRDSQEICFVPNKDYPAYLRLIAPDLVNPGPIVDTSGKVLGQHEGISFYTVGQRKRLGIAVGEPRYVIRVDPDTNTVIVGSEEELYSSRLFAKDMNLIAYKKLPATLVVTAKIRYNAKDSAAVVRAMFKNTAEVVFDEPQRAITPGQAVVFYQDEIVVGGGTIADAREAESIMNEATRAENIE